MKNEIGASDAKTRLPELLRQIKAGKRFTITNCGEAIADLVPSASSRTVDAGAAIERFQAFMRNSPVANRHVDIRVLIEEGRE